MVMKQKRRRNNRQGNTGKHAFHTEWHSNHGECCLSLRDVFQQSQLLAAGVVEIRRHPVITEGDASNNYDLQADTSLNKEHKAINGGKTVKRLD
jgi:hypothetical protein